ncbi:hypothetical protein JYG89_06170 [Latilactobacillus curvatus]|uniref:hypothetical protein n=1 Tax=Latilactobacillus curvatus TaxID=28038 RepID=UPI001CBD27EE|nr:hypothetical protein [Latilactobacillus curvatus]MBZ1504990.1 hypothetical protein [Latilactobacillus curvatus]
MKKTIVGLVTSLGLIGLLAGCGTTKLTTIKTNYRQNGMVAVVKGSTTKKADLQYRINHNHFQKATVKDGTYVIQVPTTTNKQTVTVQAKANGKTVQKKVTIAAGTSVGQYAKIAAQYNQALIGMALSKADQTKAQELQKQAAAAKAGQLAPADLMTLKQRQQEVQAAMQQAQQTQKDQLLPTAPKNGVTEWVATKHVTIRGSVDSQDVMGMTLITPVKALKDKAALKDFGTSFALIAQATGADSKKVMSEFSDYTKKNKKGSQTTMKTIESNGVKFNTGFSTSDLYIYITK